jgi:hypothetical protein
MAEPGDREADYIVIAAPDSTNINAKAPLDSIGAGLVVGFLSGDILFHFL